MSVNAKIHLSVLGAEILGFGLLGYEAEIGLMEIKEC